MNENEKQIYYHSISKKLAELKDMADSYPFSCLIENIDRKEIEIWILYVGATVNLDNSELTRIMTKANIVYAKLKKHQS